MYTTITLGDYVAIKEKTQIIKGQVVNMILLPFSNKIALYIYNKNTDKTHVIDGQPYEFTILKDWK